MVIPSKTKRSKYEITIGWAMKLYCDTVYELQQLIHMWGKEKCSYKEIKGEI